MGIRGSSPTRPDITFCLREGKRILQGWNPKIAGNPVGAGIATVGGFLIGLRQETQRKRIAHLHPCSKQARPCGSNSDAQNPCGFRSAEILHILKEKHFPIFYGESFDCTPQRVIQFFPPKHLPGDLTPVRQVFRNLAGSRSATLHQLGRKRSEDLLKTCCRNRKCFCAHVR
jgi:hypothetical protein